MKLISFELNEVPWRVVDHYLAQRPDCHFARLLENAISLTTHTKDVGELHPWTTWPTLHRGVYNDRHEITFINQEIGGEYPPVWELLAEQGVRVGVFGSLQSWPPPEADDGYAFYVPDTFAPDASTRPERYQAFQRFNLAQVERDGAIAGDVDVSAGLVRDAFDLLRTGLRLRTAASLGLHLVRERLNPLYRSRRPVLQAPVALDFFLRAYREHRPEFSTFFTNHVAGIMHRYWKYAFPEDFDAAIESPRDRFFQQSLLFAMDLADAALGEFMREADRDGAVLLVHASMGQEAKHRGEYFGELRIDDAEAFCRTIGFTRPFQANLAMQPDFAFSFESDADCDAFEQRVLCLVDTEGEPIVRTKRTHKTLSVALGRKKEYVEAERVWLVDGEARREVPIAELGMKRFFRDPGTGYHQPDGISIFYRKGLAPAGDRAHVESAVIAPTLLRLFGASVPSYMHEPSQLVLDRLLNDERPQLEPA